jgi:hypothetical protein
MATLVGSVLEIEPSTRRVSTTIKSRFTEMWPQSIVAIGLGLSLAWTASLLWVLYEIV